MKLNILPLSQRDERWKLKRLGNSTVTIGNYGCLLACHSMYLRYLGQDLLPDALNEVYKTKGVFDPEGNINFWAAGDAFEIWTAEERYLCYDIPCELSKIDHYLDRNMPVIAMVDFSPVAGVQTHFVLIVGKENNSYLINDPWTGETYFFEAKYGDPNRYIFGLRLYLGKEVPNGLSCEDKLAKAEITISSLTDENSTLGLENDELRKALKTEERNHRETQQELEEIRNQRNQAVREKEVLDGAVKGLENKVNELEGQGEVLRGKVTALRLELTASVASQIKDMGFFKLLKLYFSKEVK